MHPRQGDFATSASRCTRGTAIGRLLAVAALTLGGAGIPVAAAQPGATLAPPATTPPLLLDAPPPRPRSYRRQIMIADGVAAGTIAAAAAAGTWMFDPDDFHLPLMIGSIGFTSFVLTAPIIHMGNGRVGRGLLSGTLRVVGPAIVASTAVTARGLEEDDDGYGATFVAGMAAGVAGAMVLDWWLLVPDAAPRRAPAPRLTPVAAVARTGGVLGVAGTW